MEKLPYVNFGDSLIPLIAAQGEPSATIDP